MNFYEFATGSPYLTFFLLFLFVYLVTMPIRLLLRHLNIRKAGWPPAYLDADGDHKEAPDDAA